MFVVLIPSATAIVAQYLEHSVSSEDTRVAIALYSTVFLGTGRRVLHRAAHASLPGDPQGPVMAGKPKSSDE